MNWMQKRETEMHDKLILSATDEERDQLLKEMCTKYGNPFCRQAQREVAIKRMEKRRLKRFAALQERRKRSKFC